MRTTTILGFVLSACALVGATVGACGGSSKKPFDTTTNATDPDAGDPFGFGSPDANVKDCHGLECQQVDCGSGDTTVTGTVYAPNGKLPLYDAVVYVPNATPEPLPQGMTCDQCGAVTGAPLTTALTDSKGNFVLKNAPSGDNIPLVIQIGKWRRQTTIPHVSQCTQNQLTDPELTRLPKNQTEGNMPHIALTTGGCDNLGCMLPKVGIDSSEFGTLGDGPAKAVHVYNGGGGEGPGTQQAQQLWNNETVMSQYDMLILSCECDENLTNKSAAKGSTFAAMTDYLNAGGRIFTTDFMYTWYKYSPDGNLSGAAAIAGGAPIGGPTIDMLSTFPKAAAMVDWMKNTGGGGPSITADTVFSNIQSVDSSRAEEWASGTSPNGPRVFTINTPVGQPAAMQCGRGVHIDAHINDTDHVDQSYPTSCSPDLNPAEYLLAFFFFDLASCISDDSQPPQPPNVN
jgi:hypothetical protein